MSPGLRAVQTYLDRLPDGIRSYPECQIKWGAGKGALGMLPLQADPELPRECLQLLEEPPLPSAWVSEVAFHTWLTYAAAQYYESEQDFTKLFIESNRELFNHFAYRVMFRLVGPRTIVNQVGQRWESFHRGTTMSSSKSTRRSGQLHLQLPPHHCSLLLGRAYAGAVIAALEVSGGKQIRVEVEAPSPTAIVFDCRWR